jgi:single-stranded DNA-binding protein
MSSVGLNKWIVSGNLAADAEVKTVQLQDGKQAQVINATIYVRSPKDREDSFMVDLAIWEKSAAWRKLPYLKKGSLIICTGNVDLYTYLSKDKQAKARIKMSVLDIDLDIVKGDSENGNSESFRELVTA